MAHDVFLSYSSKDKVIADTIVAMLEQLNIRCWYAPRDIKPGDDWGKSITEAIKKSKVFLIVFSGNANKSQRVLDEVNFAITQEITILPFRVENLEPSDAMMLHLSSRHWLDAYDPSWEENLSKLATTVSSHLGVSLSDVDIKPNGAHLAKKKIGKKSVRVFRNVALAIFFSAVVFVGIMIVTKQIKFNVPSNTIPTITITVTPAPISETVEPDILPVENGVLNLAYDNQTVELDPHIYNDPNSTTLVDNLFLTLTKYDSSTGEIVPEAAESWSISLDGSIYTFKIRSDIPWVTHTLGGETEITFEENGNPRYLTAQDFVSTIRQICMPDPDSNILGYLFYKLIKGCQDVVNFPDPNNVPEELLEGIGVRAISTDELIIELENPAAYFLSMTSNPIMSAKPYWSIEKYGTAWKSPGVIVTNGYYVINNFQLGENIQLVRNNLLPTDLMGKGNITEINIRLGVDIDTAYDLWEKSEIDIAYIPKSKIEDHLKNYSNQILEEIGNNVVFLELNNERIPFNNVVVRRAFAAALDKGTYIKNFKNGAATPINHIGIPGIVGAPPLNEIGISYDVELAKRLMHEAGYPNCQGFPSITLKGSTNRIIPDEVIHSWEQALGCAENTISTEFNDGIDRKEGEIRIIGWIVDYPDENNLISDLFSCTSLHNGLGLFYRECNSTDELIEQAMVEINPAIRANLYMQIEEDFFGKEGEFPVIPFYIDNNPYAVQTGLKASVSPLSIMPYYDWTIND
jgi:oligopeptide transport system substrate-binding protein